MAAYWKVKIALVYKDSMYIHSKDLGYMSVEDAKKYAQEEADDVYDRLRNEFHLPSWMDCARDLFEDFDVEAMEHYFSKEDLDYVDKYFDMIKSRYLSWGLEEVK